MKALLVSIGIIWASISLATTQTIRVTDISQPFVINMPENPTSGYIWFLSAYDANILTPLNKSYTTAASQVAGAPSIATWRFESRVQVPTITTLRFSAQRPWAISDQAQSSTYMVVIQPPAPSK